MNNIDPSAAVLSADFIMSEEPQTICGKGEKHPAGRNNPCEEKEQDRDESGRLK